MSMYIIPLSLFRSFIVFSTLHLFYDVKKKSLFVFASIIYSLLIFIEYFFSINDILCFTFNFLFLFSYYLINTNKKSCHSLVLLLGIPTSLFVNMLKVSIEYLFNITPIYLHQNTYYFIDGLSCFILVLIIMIIYNFSFNKKLLVTYLLFLLSIPLFIGCSTLAYIYDQRIPFMIINEAFIGLIVFLLLHIYFDYKHQLDKNNLNESLEKSQRIYKNYKYEYDKLLKLKHDLLSKSKDLSDNDIVILDDLLNTIIRTYSNNEILNSILIEQIISAEEKEIECSVSIKNDLFFLEEKEIVLLFSYVFSYILENSDTRTLDIFVNSKMNNHTIFYRYNDSNLHFDTLWNKKMYKELSQKYNITQYVLKEEKTSLYCINLIHGE